MTFHDDKVTRTPPNKRRMMKFGVKVTTEPYQNNNIMTTGRPRDGLWLSCAMRIRALYDHVILVVFLYMAVKWYTKIIDVLSLTSIF